MTSPMTTRLDSFVDSDASGCPAKITNIPFAPVASLYFRPIIYNANAQIAAPPLGESFTGMPNSSAKR